LRKIIVESLLCAALAFGWTSVLLLCQRLLRRWRVLSLGQTENFLVFAILLVVLVFAGRNN
jgi:hypothetical protein